MLGWDEWGFWLAVNWRININLWFTITHTYPGVVKGQAVDRLCGNGRDASTDEVKQDG
jgi:hypothetical protein